MCKASKVLRETLEAISQASTNISGISKPKSFSFNSRSSSLKFGHTIFQSSRIALTMAKILPLKDNLERIFQQF